MKHKILSIAAVAALSLGAASCSDYLDKEVDLTQQATNVFNDYDMTRGFLARLYDYLPDAFAPYNSPPLADMDLHIVYRERLLARPAAGTALAPLYAMDDAVAVAFLYPGITEAALRPQLLAPGTKAVVLRTFGAGNAPTETWFTDLVAEAVGAGKVVVNVTQCPAGGVEEKRYATGDALAKAGVVSGCDMTCEAGPTKLLHLFGPGLTAAEVTAAMTRPLAGELTVGK